MTDPTTMQQQERQIAVLDADVSGVQPELEQTASDAIWRDGGIDELPREQSGIDDLLSGSLDGNPEGSSPRLEQTTEVELAQEPSQETPAPEQTLQEDPNPSLAEMDRAEINQEPKTFLSRVAGIGKSVISFFTSKQEDKESENLEENKSFLQEAWDVVSDFTTATVSFITNPFDVQKNWDNWKTASADAWDWCCDCATQVTEWISGDTEKKKADRALQDEIDPDFVLGAQLLASHITARCASVLCDDAAHRIENDGVEKPFLDRIHLEQKKRLQDMAQALWEYGEAIAREEQFEEIHGNEEAYLFRDEREKLVELVEQLLDGVEDNPELVNHLYDLYREDRPVSVIVDELLRRAREEEDVALSA